MDVCNRRKGTRFFHLIRKDNPKNVVNWSIIIKTTEQHSLRFKIVLYLETEGTKFVIKCHLVITWIN
jgi:hypothetical protein